MNCQTRNIIGVASLYPSAYRPVAGIFTYRLFQEWLRQGSHVDVVAPQSWTQKVMDPVTRRQAVLHDDAAIRRPLYSNLASHLAPSLRLGRKASHRSFARAVDRALRRLNGRHQWLYAHFLLTGLACLPYCRTTSIPCFVGIGESDLGAIERLLGPAAFADALKQFSGIIAVSKQAEQFCRQRCPSLGSRLTYIPNGVDTALYAPRNRAEARSILNLHQDLRIAVFCGHFVERKGPFRVLAAVNRLENVQVAFLGEGKPAPSGPRVLYAGPVAADAVPVWLAAADVFVLPSLSEGMSNAILEALACGLPVVVADRPFNREFLSADCAVFVDPTSPEDIGSGIACVLEDENRRRQMSQAALALAGNYSLSRRAARITTFVDDVVLGGQWALEATNN